ncbi:unnamed protein product [Ectocarpus fasciculatus]
MAASTNDEVGRHFLGGVAVVEDDAAEEREEPTPRNVQKPVDASPVAAKEGHLGADDGGDYGSDQRGSDSEYDYNTDSDSEMEDPGERPKHPAEADADEFIDGVDGMSARVQLSPTTTNIWVYVDPRRLSEGRAPGTRVETVGLDPSKGLVVMLTTPHDYISSGKCPKVVWARQVAPMDVQKMGTYGSMGKTFPHEWMLCGKIQTQLTRAWSQGIGQPRTDDERVKGGDQPEQGMGVTAGRDGGSPVREGGVTAATAAGEGRANGKTGGGKLDSAAIRRAVKTICESTVVSAGFAGYVLRISKYDEQQAQLSLADEEQRPVLKAAFMEFTELKKRFPQVDEASLGCEYVSCFDAVAAHPGSLDLQRDYLVCMALAQPLLYPMPQPKGETGDGDDLLDQYRRAELKKLAETNPLVCVALTVIERLKNITETCLVCGDQIQGHTVSMPTVCHQRLCTSTARVLESRKRWSFRFHQAQSLTMPPTSQAQSPTMPPARQVVRKKPQLFEVPPDIVLVSPAGGVEGQVLNNGEAVELLIDLFCRALEGTRPELGFPDEVFGLYETARRRDKSVVEKVRLVLNTLPSVVEMQRCIRGEGSLGDEAKLNDSIGELSSPSSLVWQMGGNGDGGSVGAQCEATTAVAGVDDGRGGGEDSDAGPKESPAGEVFPLKKALSKIDPLLYPLLEWLLSTIHGGHLHLLREAEAIQGVSCKKQFVLTDTSEREKHFQAMKREAAASSNGTGSFFAFHGSAPGNWHGILRLGIKNMSGSEYMSNGAVKGKGIYMGCTLSASLSYTRDVHRPVMRNKPGSTKATPATAARPKATNRGIVAAVARAASRVFSRVTTKSSGAAASSTAANATSATAAAPGFSGSPSTQGVASGGRGGHGNRVNPPAVNAPKAPAIIAVCEVIDRPEYKRDNRLLVIPDESCVATRFLLLDPSGASVRLANGDLAAAAATRYASIHRAL